MLARSERIDVALFPIPNVVAFPGTVLPLHVFEPRYRKLVRDCVDNDRMVGVSHVIKTIHKPAERQTLEEALSSNQATYKPREIFSAGPCEVVETIADGRIIANVRMRQRLALVDELQSLPYRIVSCIVVEDEEPAVVRTDNSMLRQLICARLMALVGEQNPDFVSELSNPEWTSIEPAEFSFKIFQFLHFEADVMQHILEMQSANARLEMIWDLLRRA